MKLHLPCALHSALLACFALACTASAWAATEIQVTGNESAYYFQSSQDTEFTLVPASSGVAEGISITTPLDVCDSVTINIGSSTSKFSSIELNDIQVAHNKDLTIRVAAGTTLYLDNVNFTGNVTYILEDGCTLFISANDLSKGCIQTTSGSSSVHLTGGSVDISETSGDFYWVNATDYYQSSVGMDEFAAYLEQFSAAGASVTYVLDKGEVINLYNSNGGGGPLYGDSGRHTLYWGVAGQTHVNIDDKGKPEGEQRLVYVGAVPRVTDDPSVIILPGDVYRDGPAGGQKYWYLQKDISVQTLRDENSLLGDMTERVLATLTDEDELRFAGGALTSSKNVEIGSAIGVDGTNKVMLAPEEGTTMIFTNGNGALSNKNGLILCGGSGSTVILKGVQVTEGKNITIESANTTLAIEGPDTFTFDATQNNTFRSDSHLRKDDGGTLIYKAKTTDEIGALTNQSGILEIQRAASSTTHTLDVSTLTAHTLKIAQDFVTVLADTVNVTDLELADAMNGIAKLDTSNGTLSATGKVAAGSYSQILAMNATIGGALTLDMGASLTASTSVEAKGGVALDQSATLTSPYIATTGITTLKGSDGTAYSKSGTVTSGSVSITAKDKTTASLEDMLLNGNALTTKSVANAFISVQVTKAKAAGSLLQLGYVTNTTISAKGDTTVANTVLDNSTVTGTGNITLQNTTHGPDSTVATIGSGASITLQNATVYTDGAIIVGATDDGKGMPADGTGVSYVVADDVHELTVSGTASGTTLTINEVHANLTGNRVESATPITIISSEDGGEVEMGDGWTFVPLTDAGMVAYADFQNGKLVYDLVDESGKLIAVISETSNAKNVAKILEEEHVLDGTDSISQIYDYLRDTTRADEQLRKKALEALASGSITMLADSQRQGVTRTVNSLRNRIVQMGNPQGIESETNVHAWIEADGSYSDIDQDGGLAGYEYSTWGGTVGVHADVGDLSFGAAISAAYGDLTSHAEDHAEGDHDSYSLSAFVRHQHGSWMQMGILSLGRNELDVQRRINTPRHYGESKVYDADGDASGHTITAYYEAGYTISLNEGHTQVLQPLASIMLTSARMGDFAEQGSIGNAGLCADTTDYFYGTVGIGARYQVVLAEDVNARLSFLELRAKLVQDFGDETNEATVSFRGVPGQSFTVKGAEVGRTGFQFGAGLSVPVGMYSTFFADVDADIRSGATSVNGGIGLRVEF